MVIKAFVRLLILNSHKNVFILRYNKNIIVHLLYHKPWIMYIVF